MFATDINGALRARQEQFDDDETRTRQGQLDHDKTQENKSFGANSELRIPANEGSYDAGGCIAAGVDIRRLEVSLVSEEKVGSSTMGLDWNMGK